MRDEVITVTAQELLGVFGGVEGDLHSECLLQSKREGCFE